MGQEQELKWRIQDELRKVPMKAPVKTLVWDLLSRIDPKTGVIPARHTPSLTELEGSTCLGRSTVTTYMRALEATGWVVRERPSVADSLGHGQRTQYRLAVGSFDLPSVIKHEKHTRKPRKDSAVSAGSGADLGQELNHDRSGDGLAKDAETGRESSGADLPRNGARSGDDLELGQEMTSTRSGDDLNKEPLTEVLSSSVHQDSPSAADAASAQPLPGFENTDQAPAKPKRKRATKAPSSPKEPTQGQRVNTLAKRYTDIVKLAPFHGVRNVVETAVKTGEYTDEQIAAGLDHLALPENRDRLAVTTNSLRIAMSANRAPASGNRAVSTASSLTKWKKGTSS